MKIIKIIGNTYFKLKKVEKYKDIYLHEKQKGITKFTPRTFILRFFEQYLLQFSNHITIKSQIYPTLNYIEKKISSNISSCHMEI